MTRLADARSGYARAAAMSPQPRDTEYRAFADVTRRLAEHDTVRDGFPALADALVRNQRLWSALAADVAAAGNGLPDGLRAQIFYLADFTRAQSLKVLHDRAPHDILVEINTAVMRGLKPQAAS